MNPQASVPVYEQTELDRLRIVIARAYPDRPEILDHLQGANLRETWLRLQRLLGISGEALAAAIAGQLGLAHAATLGDADPFATRFVPEKIAQQELIVPLREQGDRLVVASACPIPGPGLSRVRFLADRRLEVVVASAELIESSIPGLYARAAELKARGIGTITLTQDGLPAVETLADESAIVQLARQLVLNSVEARASDLHVEPFAGGGIVRMRVDGILRRVAFIPATVRNSLVRYFKANGAMDPTNDRVAQDGRMSLILGNRDIELRLSVLPASRGESLVIRFLDQSRVFRLGNSGFSVAAIGRLRKLALNTAGVIIVTGPTGSGKSSTLYALLSEINRIGIKVVTIENPVEYRLPGIAQVDVNPKAGLTFSTALRSILRQDPDVILVGEIRDAETAEIAMQAALTGHLVLTTLHTNDALSTLPRLLDLGVQASIIADAVIGIVAQRLVRKLCVSCRQPIPEAEGTDERLFLDATGELPAYRPVGCDVCAGTGYFGRLPVAEIVEMNPALQAAISAGERDFARLRTLADGPLSSLAEGAARRVISGDTTARECTRVIGARFWTETALRFGRGIPANAATMIGEEDSLSDGLTLMYFHARKAGTQEIATALREMSHRVIEVTDPEEARTIVSNDDTIALLIIDLEGDDESDSMERLKRLRVGLAWSRLPALLIVSPEHRALQALLGEHGVSDHLLKPVTPDTVTARLRAILAR